MVVIGTLMSHYYWYASNAFLFLFLLIYEGVLLKKSNALKE